MSTHIYLKCLDHDPPLYSGEESGQHLSALADIRNDLANRDRIPALMAADLWPNDHFRVTTMRFLAKHPTCRIGIEDEYGHEHPTKAGA